MVAPAPAVARPVVALFSLGGCGGNRLALIGLEDALMEVADLRPDDLTVRADIALVDGAVVGQKDEERLRAIREQSETLVALGTCAVNGGMAAMAGAAQGTDAARRLADVVLVDATITGCPAEPAEVLASLAHLLRGDPTLPRPYPVCTECRVRETRCVLADDDAVCLGPVTAAGCGARCPALAIGCVGCRGPAPDANWTSALDLFTDRGSDPEDIVRKMRTFAPAPVGGPRLHRGSGEPGSGRFEQVFVGRGWKDVPGLASRISAGSAVAHSQTAARVIERAFDIATSDQTEALRDLLWRGQSIAAHAQELDRLARRVGAAGRASDAARRLMALGSAIRAEVGGHAVHPVNAIPGGFGRSPDARTLDTLRERLEAARDDVGALVDLVRALSPGPLLEAGRVHVALRQDERYRYDHGGQVIILADGERWSVAAEALPKVLAEFTSPITAGPVARLVVNGDRLGPLGSELLAALDVETASPDATTPGRARAIELAMDVHRAVETLDRLLETGVTTERPAAVVPQAGLAGIATEAPAGLLLYQAAFDARGHVRWTTIVTPGQLAGRSR